MIAFQESLLWREQTIKHLCHPPNPSAIDPGHIRAQLLDENTKLNDLLNAAKGEATIFLRGHGLRWLYRRKYLRQIKKKQRKLYRQAVSREYRTVLQQTSLSKSKH